MIDYFLASVTLKARTPTRQRVNGLWQEIAPGTPVEFQASVQPESGTVMAILNEGERNDTYIKVCAPVSVTIQPSSQFGQDQATILYDIPGFPGEYRVMTRKAYEVADFLPHQWLRCVRITEVSSRRSSVFEEEGE